MYRDLHQRLQIGRPPQKTNLNMVIRHRRPVGLSLNLTRMLQKSLYPGLCRYRSPAHSETKPHITASVYRLSAPKSSTYPPSLPCVFVRNVRMLPRESISHIFSVKNGLISDPLSQGRILLLTNLRVITFGQESGIRETLLVPLEEIKEVSVTAGQRSKGTLFQGGLMIVAAVLFYVLLAYWLTGRIDGPQVPMIRMDLIAFVVFLVILMGVAVLSQIYFTKPNGKATFQGDGVKITFPFKGDKSEDEMYVLVNAAFAARQSILD